MPYKNITKKRNYHKEYAKQHPVTLTDEQRKAKSEYAREYRKKNIEKFREYQKNRYQRDKEQIALRQKEYRDRNKEEIKVKKQKYYEDNKEYFADKAKRYYEDNKDVIRKYKKHYAHRAVSRFQAYVKSAKVRGYEFNLTYPEFEDLFNDKCHYCNLEQSKGVDRKDNSVGYTTENSLPCCKACNYMKRDTSYEEFKLQIKKIHNNLK